MESHLQDSKRPGGLFLEFSCAADERLGRAGTTVMDLKKSMARNHR